MLRVFAGALIAVSIGSQVLAQSAAPDPVNEAVAAVGGEQALRSLKSLKIVGEGKHWEPDQSYAPGGPVLFVGDSRFTMTWDLASGMARTSWDRILQGNGRMQYDEVVTPKYGFVTDEAGNHAMSGIRVAAHLRELHRIAPNLVLRMRDNAANTRFEGGIRTGDGVQPAVSFRDGATTFTVIFNRKTHLPAIVRTQDDDGMRGTAYYDVRLDDWKPVAGVLVAHQLTYVLGDAPIGRIRYTSVTANAPVDTTQYALGDAIKAAAKPPASGNIPYQWVIRRLNLGRLFDSDRIFVPEGGGLKLVELAPNVQHVVGGSHNNLIVNMKDGLVVLDAPINDAQSRWVIDAAREKYGKPVKHLVLTHHHSDHAGGVRAYMAEGATIHVPEPARKYFVKVALAEHLVPDDLQKKRLSPQILEIKDRMVLKDDTVEIRLFRIPNHHAEGMLIAHIMPANIVWTADLWAPGRDKFKTNSSLSFHDALRRYGISGATIAGGQGATAPQSALEAIIGAR